MTNIRTGKAATSPEKPSHVKGVNQGNAVGNYDKAVGHLPDGRSTAARSTGVDPHRHEPIDPRMPNISPP